MFVSVSRPPPRSIPAAFASVVDVESAEALPFTVTATLPAFVVEVAFESMVPLFVTLSLPATRVADVSNVNRSCVS